MAEERGTVVGSIMGSPSILVSEPGAAIRVVETKLTGRLREALTAHIDGPLPPPRARDRRKR